MRVVQIPDVEQKRYRVIDAGQQQFMEKLLGANVSVGVPNHPLDKSLQGYAVHFLSRNEVWLPVGDRGVVRAYGTEEVSLAMQALHTAFSQHVPFSLSPQMAWYLIAHEVAVHIEQNQDTYRHYFTASRQKETIEVRDDSLVYGSPDNNWARTIGSFHGPMGEKVPKPTIDLMLPRFSETTQEEEVSLLVLFLNMVSNYYGLMVHTLCGVPSVRVEGTLNDWKTLVRHAEMCSGVFEPLKPYFADLVPVLKEISSTVGGEEPDPEFWRSIYKYGGGSGGPYINGWITAFLAHRMGPGGFEMRPDWDLDWRSNASNWGGITSEELPTHISVVPFTWNYYGTEIPMAFMAGVLGVEHDQFLTPKLGFGVLEDCRKQK